MKHGMHIKNMSFKFSSRGRFFFENINFTILPKKIYFLQGVNGSGKSTLFRLLQGNLQEGEVLHGSVVIDATMHDLSLSTSNQVLHGLVSAVQQDYDGMLADRFTFEENLRLAQLPCYPKLKLLPNHQSVPTLIQRFNIDSHTPVHLLSGGQRQILAVLMALQKRPSLLLLDEPTAALDNVNTHMVLKFLYELVASTDITVLIISHDQTVIKEYAQENYFQMHIDSATGIRSVESTDDQSIEYITIK